ncbi:MAG TPA: M24 family metallopeptidase, partial [Spirochaetota bacterium]|nr:M24 family metallopeptidase [Spirochaetota bacterium]
PVNGRFTAAQRRVYDAVLAAQTAGIEACRAGALFADVHRAAITVLAGFFEEASLPFSELSPGALTP